MGAGVVAWDACCGPDEMLSEACDRYLLFRPWVTRATVAVTGLHLLNLIPNPIDPFCRLSDLVDRLRHR